MVAAEAGCIEVSVAYALPDNQCVVALEVPRGTTAAEAVLRSGILRTFPEIALDQSKLGVFGRRVPHDHVVSPGDRVEIYRTLTADPKVVRRERAKSAAPKPRRSPICTTTRRP